VIVVMVVAVVVLHAALQAAVRRAYLQLATAACPLLHVGVVVTPPASHVSAEVPPSPQELPRHSQAPELGHVESAQQTASGNTDALQASTSVSPATSPADETSHSQPSATSMQ
jgi:hypothetical protein